jgi:hypothetical protein
VKNNVNPKTQTVTKILLKRYLENGTVDAAVAFTSLKKLVKDGFVTKNLGGYANNSSNGLNAWFTI